MIYGYIRVSTSGQTTENQKLAIKGYCKKMKLTPVHWIEGTISGLKNPERRKLGELLKNVQPNDTIIMTELSRLGRSLVIILNVLQNL